MYENWFFYGDIEVTQTFRSVYFQIPTTHRWPLATYEVIIFKRQQILSPRSRSSTVGIGILIYLLTSVPVTSSQAERDNRKTKVHNHDDHIKIVICVTYFSIIDNWKKE